MNIAKNMEAIFIIAIAMVGATGIATADTRAPQPVSASVATVQLASDAGMTVIHVSAKRLSAAEKAAL